MNFVDNQDRVFGDLNHRQNSLAICEIISGKYLYEMNFLAKLKLQGKLFGYL
ncbi:MAG: hypothetical protein QNJ74_05765 [Trichodesmium sp. MO_231.B1]|nr:hypothetical protein [Trichodesmium sp. MO_231.B1]